MSYKIMQTHRPSYKIVQRRYYASGKPIKTHIRTFKSHWRARLYKFWFYTLAEPLFRMSVDWDIEVELGGEMRSWAVDVFDDSMLGEHRRYCVPAISGDGAMLLAFILHKGLPDTAYSDGGYLELGVMELAKGHCRIVSVENYS